jgi:uncharacterized protein DUF6344
MAVNKVMKLWTAVVTAFLALCTALGLITTTAAAAVPQTQPERNSSEQTTLPAQSQGTRTHNRSLPPTMKQRIRAEAHGSSPACRHRQPAVTVPATTAHTVPLARSALRSRYDPVASPFEPSTRLQR